MSGLALPEADRLAGGTVDDLARFPGRNAALFLDVDGTLLDIAKTPDAVVVPDDLGALLDELDLGLGGAVALISGRSLAQIDGLFSSYRFAAAGQHGAELRPVRDGAVASGADPRLDPIRAFGRALTRDHARVLVEDKGRSIAFHYRQAPDLEDALRLALVDALAGHAELEILVAKMAFDIKPRGLNKGTAVTRLMASPPFSGRIPIFVGDDVTDRFGMQAAKAAGGTAIQVGRAPLQHSEVFEDFTLPSPAAVRRWLRHFAERTAGGTLREEGRAQGPAERSARA